MRFIPIILIVLLTSCGTTKKNTSNAVKNIDEEAKLVISYLQTSGYNKLAPKYEIKLFNNRQMYLDAIRNLDITGKHMRTLSEKEYNALIKAFTDADFFEFEDSYTSDMTDLPSRYLYFCYDGKEKKILDYYGAPEELKELELLVQSFLDRVGWIKMSW